MKDLSVVYTVLTSNLGFGGGHITRTGPKSESWLVDNKFCNIQP
jgi:hypothetical protein